MSGARLDTELVRRGLARSRSHAAHLIAADLVTVAGRRTVKAATSVSADDGVRVAAPPGGDYASRGAHKLIGALDACAIDVTGRRVLDAGASTGGFTDVLLRRGAAAVAAVDVGTGQLDPRLAADPRVHVLDHTNLRLVDDAGASRVAAMLGGGAHLVVADLSFISLTLVLPALIRCATADADLLPMVKPQFEVGRGRLDAHGVVRDPRRRADAVAQVADAAAGHGWGLAAVTASPLPGPTGNVEYFLHLRTDAPRDGTRTRRLIDRAVDEGPA